MGRGLDGCFSASCRPSAVFKLHGGRLYPFRWRDSERETPLPIPNRAVKPLCADGTWRATSRESRSPPVLPEPPNGAALFLSHFLGVSLQLKEWCTKSRLSTPLPLRGFPTLPFPSMPASGVISSV